MQAGSPPRGGPDTRCRRAVRSPAVLRPGL